MFTFTYSPIQAEKSIKMRFTENICVLCLCKMFGLIWCNGNLIENKIETINFFLAKKIKKEKNERRSISICKALLYLRSWFGFAGILFLFLSARFGILFLGVSSCTLGRCTFFLLWFLLLLGLLFLLLNRLRWFWCGAAAAATALCSSKCKSFYLVSKFSNPKSIQQFLLCWWQTERKNPKTFIHFMEQCARHSYWGCICWM